MQWPLSRPLVNRAIRSVPQWLVWLLAAIPAFRLVFLALTDALGADPLRALEHSTGRHALQFLIATLCVAPLQRLTGISFQPHRRALGLIAASYAALHLTIWIGLDLQFRWPEIATDLTKRPYITLGMFAVLLLFPLVCTSTNAAMRRLGPQSWRRLHLLVWPATFAACAHYVLVAKTWRVESLLYLAVCVCLLAQRLILSAKSKAALKRG